MDAVKWWKAGWGYPTTMLCVYGFFSTVKPLVPFIYPYLTGPDKNLTVEQVTNEIYPVWTYSYLAVMVPVFLLTDWLRYKPVVVFQCINLFITWAMMLLVQEVAVFKAMQFFYGVKSACEVAYFSYIYSIVDLKYYRKATSYCRSVQLLGYTVGSVLGQLLVSFNLMSYNNILVLTLVLISIALVTSLFLPMPQRSMFFHRSQSDPPQTPEGGDMCAGDVSTEGPVTARGCSQVFLLLWRDFLQCYSTRALLYWSLWWVLATCGYNQAINYVQVLWAHIQPSQKVQVYNGGVEAVSNLFGAATAYGIGFIQVDWAQWGELFLGSISGLGAVALFIMTFTDNIWVCYAGYVAFKGLYMLLITFAMFQIATDLSMERYALIFGANNFGSLVLQTIITSVVVDGRGLGLGIIPQFIIYGSYFSAIAVIFFLRGVSTIMRVRQSHRDSTTAEEPPSPTMCTPLQRSLQAQPCVHHCRGASKPNPVYTTAEEPPSPTMCTPLQRSLQAHQYTTAEEPPSPTMCTPLQRSLQAQPCVHHCRGASKPNHVYTTAEEPPSPTMCTPLQRSLQAQPCVHHCRGASKPNHVYTTASLNMQWNKKKNPKQCGVEGTRGLKRLNKFGLAPKTFIKFYTCTIENILSGCIPAWHANCTVHNRRALQKVVQSAKCITGGTRPALSDIYSTRCHRKAKKIIKEQSWDQETEKHLISQGHQTVK
ncbi:thiamine transporter 1-like [Oncorhynchus masou masou]|uniref:thiamine transporter 1-like n=1 Tax=Oncorhynchus masou masou TaxID=90313 RepID=UPI0031837083